MREPKKVNLYIDIDAGVIARIYGDAVPGDVVLFFHIRDSIDILTGDQIDPLDGDYQPEKVYL